MLKSLKYYLRFRRSFRVRVCLFRNFLLPVGGSGLWPHIIKFIKFFKNQFFASKWTWVSPISFQQPFSCNLRTGKFSWTSDSENTEDVEAIPNPIFTISPLLSLVDLWCFHRVEPTGIIVGWTLEGNIYANVFNIETLSVYNHIFRLVWNIH